jgi:hypothetical protein
MSQVSARRTEWNEPPAMFTCYLSGGCGSDDDPAAVVDAYGRELRYIGVRRTGTRVELVVDTEVPAR